MKIAVRFLFLLAILCYSCENVDPFEIDEVDFGEPEVGVPLVNSIFFIADIGVDPKNNTDVISDSEGRVTLRYSDEIKPISITEVFPRVKDEQVSIAENPQAFNLPFHDIDIRAGILKNTRVHFEMSNPTNESLTITISIPGLKSNTTNIAYNQSYTLAAGQAFRSSEEDLSEYIVTSPNGELELSYTAVTATNTSVVISDFNIDFAELNFSYLEGVFSDVVLPSTDDLIDISFFDSWVSGGLNLSDPKLKFEIENSIGVPAQLKLNYANITNIDDVSFDLESELLNDGISFDYPSVDNVGGSAATTVEINGTNSNVVELFNKKPKAIDYDLDLSIDSDQGTVGFYTDESRIKIDAIVELPLYLRANDLVLQDTIGFEEIAFDDIDGTAELQVSLRNAFPIGVGVNLYFMNDNGDTLFSLVEADEWISVEANTEASLTVEELEAQVLSIPISEDDVLLLPSVSNVLMRVLVTTTDSFADDYVWVYDHHGIEVKLGAVLR